MEGLMEVALVALVALAPPVVILCYLRVLAVLYQLKVGRLCGLRDHLMPCQVDLIWDEIIIFAIVSIVISVVVVGTVVVAATEWLCDDTLASLDFLGELGPLHVLGDDLKGRAIRRGCVEVDRDVPLL